MSKKILCLCLAFVITMCSFTVFAEAEAEEGFSNVKVDYVRESGMVTISGTAGFAESPDEPVRLMVLKPDSEGSSNIEDLIAGKVTLSEVCIHIDETMLDENKKFEFIPFVLSEDLTPGEYVVRLAAETTEYSETISVAGISETFDILNNAEASGEVLSAIEKYNDVFGLDITEKSDYAGLSEEGQEFVLSNMINEDYADADGVKERFNTYVQLYRVYMGPWGKTEEIIGKYASLLEITSYVAAYNELSQSKKDDVYKELSGVLFEDAASFSSAFDEAVKKASEKTEDKRPQGKGGGSGIVSATVVTPVTKAPEEEPKKDEQPLLPFGDIQNHAWAQESILKLYNKGIVNGKAEGVFAPNDYVSRAEAVKMILLAFNMADDSAKCNFSDVAENSWYYPYIARAYEMQFIFGYNDGTVGAEHPITREDFAVIIVRVLKKAGIELSTSEEKGEFADSEDISEYAKEAVNLLKEANILNGTGDNMFMPKKSITRAETAKVIAALIS